MKILKVNELMRSTYLSAADKLNKKQPGRSKRLRSYGDEKGLYKNFWTIDHEMDVYVDHTIDGDDYGVDIWPKSVIKGLTFEDNQERQDENLYSIGFNLNKTEHPNWYLNLSIEISHSSVMINLFDDDNKFTNRKSLMTCIKYLHKLYLYSDPNRTARAMANINNVDLSELTYEDVDEDNFWGFLNQFGYDWDKFRKSIKINDLWDYYDE